MIKNTFYFKHDNNARHHPKILQLRAEFGWEGYGIFFALLEILNESNSGKINLKTIKGIALGLNINADFLEQIITLLLDTKLFHKDNDNCIYSLRVMEEKEHRQSLSEAGKKGARKKKKSNKAEATLKPPLSQVKTTLKAGEERRGKERRR